MHKGLDPVKDSTAVQSIPRHWFYVLDAATGRVLRRSWNLQTALAAWQVGRLVVGPLTLAELNETYPRITEQGAA